MTSQARARRETCSAAAPWLRSVARPGSTVWLRGAFFGSTSYSLGSIGKSGLDRGSGMQGSEHRNRGNGGEGEISRDILRDAGKAEDVDVKHLAGLPRRFEIRAGVVPQTKVEPFAGRRLLNHVGVTFELIADRRSDEIGAIRVESVLHHQVDMPQVDIAEID